MNATSTAASPVVHQRTLKNPIHCSGTGRLSGTKIAMTMRPAPPDLGIVFTRTDLGHRPWVPANWEHALVGEDSTGLANESGVEVAGIEHLMSALCGCAIDNAMIELDVADWQGTRVVESDEITRLGVARTNRHP